LDPIIFRDLKKETSYGPSVEYDGIEQAARVFSDDGNGELERLRALSAEEVLEKIKQRWPVTIDGWVFPKSPRQIYADGEQHGIPVIVGTNRDEGTMFAPRNPFGSIADYKMAMTERFGESADEVVAFYAPKSDGELRKIAVQQITDSWFVQPAREFARAMDKQGTRVWMYHFTKPVRGWMGAAHAAQIGYVFGNLEEPKPEDAALSAAFMDYWVEFATTGDPNIGANPTWPQFDHAGDQHLVMDKKIETASGLRCEACDLLGTIFSVPESELESSNPTR
jgi:para-nitrobenzyl esterase